MIQRPRGTRDLLPEDMEKRRYLEKKIREVFLSYGYREVQTPTFEHLELFTAKSGEAILEEIYSFKDKSGRDLALRPELTAPVIRMYIEKLQMHPKPIKLFYFGNCFRYDRPQKGRYREFTQVGCEFIGCDTPESLAELISLAWNCLRRSGLRGIKLRIGNLDLLNHFIESLGLDPSTKKSMMRFIDKKEYAALEDLLRGKISEEKLSDLIRFLQINNLEELKKVCKEEEEIDRFQKTVDYLEVFGVNEFEISMEIVRGLDYYKGLVFEIESPRLGAERQICGGGEYELVSIFGGREVSTAGFAIGFDRLILALEEEGYPFPKERIDFYIIPASKKDSVIKKSIEIANHLREQGKKIDIDLTNRSLKKSMKYADSMGFEKVMIVGEKDLEEGKVTVRDMKTGEQRRIEIDF